MTKDADYISKPVAHLPVRCTALGQLAAQHSPVGQQHHWHKLSIVHVFLRHRRRCTNRIIPMTTSKDKPAQESIHTVHRVLLYIYMHNRVRKRADSLNFNLVLCTIAPLKLVSCTNACAVCTSFPWLLYWSCLCLCKRTDKYKQIRTTLQLTWLLQNSSSVTGPWQP